MDHHWRHLPVSARPIASAATAAVLAAQARDDEAFTVAAGGLVALDPAPTGLILGTATRLLLEQAHPDGLDSDAVREVLAQCVRAAVPWHPATDPMVVLYLLAAALGVLDEETPAPKPDELTSHAALLLAHLLGARPPREILTAALTEIEHTQLND
ncbi:hypothetical protein M1L60_16270 [Actinoplanes sp. TRM 88003]|uniref:Uncharacterized protein n=1 Tax=Paractinoplanes aksuensis TaxID=2939490 RepID=A0ABT1DMV6_9ACTN|nr:hypothetical protein [Actinoplanes aksuensis]MCO8272150.1 hypothetical protein [Actinoplanes aksuensis]